MKKIVTVLLAASAVSAFAQIGDTSYTLSQQASQKNNLKYTNPQYIDATISNATNEKLTLVTKDSDHLQCKLAGSSDWANCDGVLNYLEIGPKQSVSLAVRSWASANVSLAVKGIFTNDNFPSPMFAMWVDDSGSAQCNRHYGGQYCTAVSKANNWDLPNLYIANANSDAQPFISYNNSTKRYTMNLTFGSHQEAVYQRDKTSVPGNKICSISNSDCPSSLEAYDTSVNSIISDNGQYKVLLEQSGHLVIYNQFHQNIWAVGTGSMGAHLFLQNDGNLVAYAANGTVAWKSDTANKGADKLIMQNDGNLVLYRGTTPVWSSGTASK